MFGTFHERHIDMPCLFFHTCLMVFRYVLDLFWDIAWTLCVCFMMGAVYMSLQILCCLGLGGKPKMGISRGLPDGVSMYIYIYIYIYIYTH